jgi:hypothetical protein
MGVHRYFHAFRVLCGIMLALLLSVTSPSGHAKGCETVKVQTKKDLSLGTLRTRPGAEGFLELHPRHGIAATGHGLVHQGPSGIGVVRVSGDSGRRVTLAINVTKQTEHDRHYLRLVELIVRTRASEARFPADHARITVTLPDRKGDEARAVAVFRIGAVARYRHVTADLALGYRLRAQCVESR